MNMAIMPSRMPPRPHKHPTNCRNCGAPLRGSVCEYCGTYYGGQVFMKVDVNLSKEEMQRMVQELKKHWSDPVILLPNTMPTITRR